MLSMSKNILKIHNQNFLQYIFQKKVQLLFFLFFSFFTKVTVHLIFLHHYRSCLDIIAFTSYHENDIRNTFWLPIAASPRNICFLLLIHGKLYEITKIREAIGVMRKYSLCFLWSTLLCFLVVILLLLL